MCAEKNLHYCEYPERVTYYTPFEDTLPEYGRNLDPCPHHHLHSSIRASEQSEHKRIRAYSQKKHDVDSVYISAAKQPQRQHVNLLYISNEKGQSHYVWIKNLSRLVHGQSSRHRAKHFICDRCLHGCNSQRSLDKHTEKCEKYRASWLIWNHRSSRFQLHIQNHHIQAQHLLADMYRIQLSVVSTDPRFYAPLAYSKEKTALNTLSMRFKTTLGK